MALISLPYAFLGQEPFFVGKITLVTKQKQMRKEKDVSFNMAMWKTIFDFLSIFFPQEQFSSSIAKNKKVACS